MEIIRSYKAVLGEGAIWNHETGELYWIDIEEKNLMFYRPGDGYLKTFKFDKKIGTVVPESGDTVIVALEDGIYRYNFNSRILKSLSLINVPGTRFNDGKCDPAGRFWAGTMHNECKKPAGSLYMMDTDESVRLIKKHVTVSNGIAWSPDHRKMYYIDTPAGIVVSYDYDTKSGEAASPKEAITIPGKDGYPDGCTIDSEGMLWIALWGGSSVGRYDPASGKLLEKIDIPALYVTSVTFGGEALDTLYITSASINDNDHPDSGYLCSVKPGIAGIKANFFGRKAASVPSA